MKKQRPLDNRGDERRDEGPDQTAHRAGELFEESVRFYLQLSALAARMHGKGALSGPRRTVLLGLARSGPRTVAQIARERAQSRQRFQPLVNALLADGLVQAVPNPAHAQSPMIALTAKGEKAVQRIREVEVDWQPRLKLPVSAARLAETVKVLRLVRAELERLTQLELPSRKGRT